MLPFFFFFIEPNFPFFFFPTPFQETDSPRVCSPSLDVCMTSRLKGGDDFFGF